jgi:hypothetical protein
LAYFPDFPSQRQETSVAVGEFARIMNLGRAEESEEDMQAMDRRVIRVEVPPAHAGITAALRRAFEAAASEPSNRDFTELLRQLN